MVIALSGRSRSGTFYPKADVDRPDAWVRQAAETPRHEPDWILSAARSVVPDVDRVEPLALGTFSEIWRIVSPGRSLVLKAARVAGEGLSAFGVESVVVDRIAAAGLPAIGVIHVDETRAAVPFEFAVLERVDAPTLRSVDSDEVAVAQGLRRLGSMLARIHELDADGFGLVEPDSPVRGSMSSWADYLGARLDEELRVVGRVVDAARVDRVRSALGSTAGVSLRRGRLMHGDSGPHNVVLRSGEPVLLDWEDALVGDPLFELAQCATFHPPRRWPALLEGYGMPDAADDERFRLYFLRITVAKAVVRIRLGLPDLPGRPTPRERVETALASV